jgi:2-polyprenyl-6-methoxyphenol hydroxylase-like FAD-dependent oxidoreductase
MDVMIIGGGIGGLTSALLLHEAGFDVEVFEAAGEIRPLGVGINVLPHSVRILDRLGVMEDLERAAVRTSSLSYHSKRGQLIWREPRGTDAGYRWPQFSLHRGHFQMVLLRHVLDRLGPERVHCGHRLADFSDDADAVRARFVLKRGETGQTEAVASLMVGADGIHSETRRHFHPHEGPPVWDGRILWRGITRAAPFLDGRSMIMAGHERQKFVCYPISPEPDEAGQQEINWIAELKFDDRAGFNREDWNRPGRLEDFLPEFEDWAFDWLDVPMLIRGADAVYEYPMVDRDPLERWGGGRITLLGDAAHPMYPIGSNGSSQAVLDAFALGEALAEHGLSSAALEAYQATRLPATSAIVLANRKNGPEQVMQMAEERAPDGFDHIHDVISPHDLQSIASRYKQTAGFDLESVNQARGHRNAPD